MVRINGSVVSSYFSFEGLTPDGENLNDLIAGVQCDQKFRDGIISSLVLPENQFATADQKFYDLVMTQSALVIVIEPGFMTQIRDADFSKNFLRNLVMTLGGTLSVDKLASYSFYGSYLRTLRA